MLYALLVNLSTLTFLCTYHGTVIWIVKKCPKNQIWSENISKTSIYSSQVNEVHFCLLYLMQIFGSETEIPNWYRHCLSHLNLMHSTIFDKKKFYSATKITHFFLKNES